MKYKIGDIVISSFGQNPGMKGKIIKTKKGNYILKWEDGGTYGSNNEYCEDLLTLVPIQTLKDLIK